jgi:hypothetical protein
LPGISKDRRLIGLSDQGCAEEDFSIAGELRDYHFAFISAQLLLFIFVEDSVNQVGAVWHVFLHIDGTNGRRYFLRWD